MLPRALCRRGQPQKAKLSTTWESRSREQACAPHRLLRSWVPGGGQGGFGLQMAPALGSALGFPASPRPLSAAFPLGASMRREGGQVC